MADSFGKFLKLRFLRLFKQNLKMRKQAWLSAIYGRCGKSGLWQIGRCIPDDFRTICHAKNGFVEPLFTTLWQMADNF